MTQADRLSLALLMALSLGGVGLGEIGAPSRARAQAPVDDQQPVAEEPVAEQPVGTEAPAAEREPGPAPDELPEGADLGPPLAERPPVLTHEELVRYRQRNYDPTEPEHPLALQVHLGIGGALDSSLDQALAAHRYGASPLIFQGDVALLSRVTEWLYLGGRIGGRGRGWLSNEVAPASAGGVDGMAIAHLRVYLGRVVDIGAILGAGIGWGGISLERGGAAAVAPRLHGSALIAFRLGSGVRLCARFAWDWFSLYDMDRYGSDLELGGPSLSLGLEIRP